MMRIGHGYDVHAFGDGDHVVLGGVWIDCDRGLVAHSDGDVMIHALCDALLGAAGLGDIGKHFPDTDERFSEADSRDLLRAVVAQLDAAGWSVGNVDLTVIAQTPRLSDHVSAMPDESLAGSRRCAGLRQRQSDDYRTSRICRARGGDCQSCCGAVDE